MSLCLAIEASSATYAVAVGGPGVRFAERSCRRDDPAFPGVGELAVSLLASVDATVDDIGLISVDVGPGNLSSVRSAVAYANGLAFSLGIQVLPVDALDLMAADAFSRGAPGLPAVESDLVALDTGAPSGHVLCLRKGEGGNAYAGLFASGEPVAMRYAPLREVVPELADGVAELAVAGAHRAEVAALLPGTPVRDTGIETPAVATLYATMMSPAGRHTPVPLATPLNEASPIFHTMAPTRHAHAHA